MQRRNVLSTVLLPVLMSCAADPAHPKEPAPEAASSVVVIPSLSEQRAPALSDAPEERAAFEEAVELRLFMMSQCPFASTLLVDQLKPLLANFGSRVRLEVDYIGSVDEAGQLKAMHGPSEVFGNLIGVCAQAHEPRFRELITCQAERPKEIETNWQSCGIRLGINTSAIENCARGEQGKQLLAASFERSKLAQAKGSPTLHIAGTAYAGNRAPTPLARGICGAFASTAPEFCKTLPAAKTVDVTLLTDSRCEDCKPSSLESLVRGRVESATFRSVDYSSPEGKQLFNSLKPLKLPAAIFDQTLQADEAGRKQLERSLRESNGTFFVEGEWNPSCADQGGCGLPECKFLPTCRTAKPKKLDLFLMSKCPYCAKGVIGLDEVMKHLKQNGQTLDLNVHFIGTGDAKTGLSSMHGQSEVDEDLRHICALKLYPQNHKYLDYFVCRAKNRDSDEWQTCTGGTTGFDQTKLQKCAEGDQAKRWLADSFAHSKQTGFKASPTWLVNNKTKFNGVDANRILENICKHNKLKGCDATLSTSSPPPIPTTKGAKP